MVFGVGYLGFAGVVGRVVWRRRVSRYVLRRVDRLEGMNR